MAYITGKSQVPFDFDAFVSDVLSAISGSHIIIERNMVTDTNTATAKYGIHVQSVDRAHIIDNQLINQISGTTGIRAVSSSGVTCTDNYIDSFSNVHSTCDSESGTVPLVP